MKSSSKKRATSIALVIGATILTSIGQILFKYASETFSFTLYGIIGNIFMWTGFISYALGFLLLVLSLKEGELSIIFPFLSLSFIWVMIASIPLFGEQLGLMKIIGTIVIVAGVSVLGIGGTK